MADIRARNGRHALVQVADAVRNFGNVVSPRGMQTREIEHMTVEIDNPYDALCVGINAKQSREVAAAEAIQLIGGFSDPGFAINHAPALEAFTNGRGEFDGAYGPRVGPQYARLVERLKDDAHTRQAVLTIWDKHDLARLESKDYPCTLVLGFAIRRDRLNLSVVMRSNDVNWGFKNDIFQFTQLQCSIANVLGIEAGKYRHTAFSMHLYQRDWKWAEDLDRGAVSLPLDDAPAGICATSVVDMMTTAARISHGEVGDHACQSHQWYVDALGGAA